MGFFCVCVYVLWGFFKLLKRHRAGKLQKSYPDTEQIKSAFQKFTAIEAIILD